MSRHGVAIQVGIALLWPAASMAAPSGGPAGAPAASLLTDAKRCSGSYSLFNPEPRSCIGPLDTDRPHLTDTPHTIPPGHFQLETELVSFGTSGRDADAVPASLGLMSFLFKVGLVPGVDFQVGYGGVSFEEGASGWSAHHAPSVYVRAKLNLFGYDAPIGLTFAPILLVPTSSRGSVQGGASLLFGAELPKEFDLEVNIVVVTEPGDGDGPRWVFAPSAALTRPIYGPLSAFVETYHELRYGSPNPFTWLGNAGLLLRLGPSMQLDAGVRIGLYGPQHPVSSFLGFSFMI
jgi:hypothetical protein